MVETQRIINELSEFRGEMKEFKKNTEENLVDIKHDVKLLNAFKWRVASGSALLAIVLTAVTDMLLTKFIK